MSVINSLMAFYQHDISISMEEKVWNIVEDDSLEQRKFLFEEYMDLHQMRKLYEDHEQAGIDKFSWKLCLEKGWLCLQDMGHFKDDMLESGITEEEWEKSVEKEWGYMGKDKVDQHMLEYDGYRKKHKKEHISK